MKLLLLMIGLTIAGFGQTVESRTVMLKGTSLPGTCTVGERFFKTDATAGQNLYLCTSTNTWTQVSGSSGASYPTDLLCNATGGGTTTITIFDNASGTNPCNFAGGRFTAEATFAITGTPAAGTYCFETDGTTLYANLPGAVTGLSAGGITMNASATCFTAGRTPIAKSAYTSGVNWDAAVEDWRPHFALPMNPVAGTGLSSSDSGSDRIFNLATFPLKSKIVLPLAACAGTTGTLLWDTLASNAPTATCSAGSTETTMIRGVADFPDSDGDYSVQVAFLTPDDWDTASNLDAVVLWRTAATSGDVVWQIQTACRADSEVDDVAWNTASTVTDTAKGTTLQLNSAAITNITKTSCAAGELLHVRLLRNRTHASDTIAAAVSLAHVELTARRSISQ